MIGLIILNLLTSNALALSYDVDWPASDKPSQYQILRVTVNGCDSTFKIPNDKLDSFKDDNKALSRVISLSVEKAKRGCR